jgi:hypothetical protein
MTVLSQDGFSNSSTGESTMAVNYSNGNEYSAVETVHKNEVTYRSPNYMDKVVKEKNRFEKGNIETIDEIVKISHKNKKEASDDDDYYYNGTRHLSEYYHNICAGFQKDPQLCASQENCGWCYSTNTCIQGSKDGPIESCLPRHFNHNGKTI